MGWREQADADSLSMLGLRCRHGARLTHSHGVRRIRPTEAPWHNLFVHSASIHGQLRGVKTKTTVRLADLPQGPIKSNASESREGDDEPSYPTVVLQARHNMRRFANCVLITRVGGFYELYFEHADEYAPLLNLKLASKKTNAGPVPMVREKMNLAKVLTVIVLMLVHRLAFLSSSWIVI